MCGGVRKSDLGSSPDTTWRTRRKDRTYGAPFHSRQGRFIFTGDEPAVEKDIRKIIDGFRIETVPVTQ